MECNKEEAIRAKEIAEHKMQNNEFVGAKKAVLKARQLFPSLDNLSQMLTICEVHCSAGINKVNGVMDWYGILQVEPTADESSIKNQYRSLALLLHPDKNKFAGAEGAFKLIGEARSTLHDPAKRSLYDYKRKSNIRAAPFRNPSKPSAYTNQQRPSAFPAPQIFWTICRFCRTRYQNYTALMNKALRCRQCSKIFIASNLNEQAVPNGGNSAGPGFRANAGGGCPSNASSSTGFQFSRLRELAARLWGEKWKEMGPAGDFQAAFEAGRDELKQEKRKELEELRASLDRARASEVAEMRLAHASELARLRSAFEARLSKALTDQKVQLEAAYTEKFKVLLASLSSSGNEKESRNANASDPAEHQHASSS